MNNYRLIIVSACFIVSLVNSVKRRRKCVTTRKFHRTGEAIAIDNLVNQYEREHQKFYRKLSEDGIVEEDIYVLWPALKNKDLSNYCRKYLQCVIPSRTFDGATGIKMRRELHYERENTSITSKVIMVRCKIRYKTAQLVYYMTTAPEPNCVYALKCSDDLNDYKFVIINKHCNFEEKTLANRSVKRKREENIGEMHRWSGQPIAKDKYLLQYELEHQEMLKNCGQEGKCIDWPHAMLHHNINLYCYQYLSECCPNRNREDVSGSWNLVKLHYEKLNAEDVDVTTIICNLPYSTRKLQYHTIRAPENNCVYSLIRKGRGNPLMVIIYKHCDFEDPANDQQTNSQEDNETLVEKVIFKTEVKEETLGILETLSLFPKY